MPLTCLYLVSGPRNYSTMKKLISVCHYTVLDSLVVAMFTSTSKINTRLLKGCWMHAKWPFTGMVLLGHLQASRILTAMPKTFAHCHLFILSLPLFVKVWVSMMSNFMFSQIIWSQLFVFQFRSWSQNLPKICWVSQKTFLHLLLLFLKLWDLIIFLPFLQLF